MKILLIGFGFYVLGNDNFLGGTIMPAILKWSNFSNENIFSITCIVKSEASKLNAEKRFLKFFKKYKNPIEKKIKIKTYDQLKKSESYDCAIIAIPEEFHLNCLKLITKNTKEIICVKPFTKNKKEVVESYKIAKTNGNNIFIDFHKRFDESNIEFIKNASNINHSDGVFSFSYGQKVEMPFNYFKKWADKSNPFQYLAPHYIDIISQVLKNSGVNLRSLKIEGSANYLTFKDKPDLISIISCNLKLFNKDYCYLINAICNWMEPKMSPFNSRQRIEFQTNSLHLISEQDNRGQFVIDDNKFKIPNPHFMTSDLNLNASGYGIDSFCNFFEYLCGRFSKEQLVSINDYEFTADLLDYINKLIKK